MEQALLRQAVALVEEIMTTYYHRRDIYAVLDRMAPDATWIGPGEREKKYTLDEMRTYFELGKDAVPSCQVSSPDLRAVDLGGDYCLVAGSITVRTTPESQMVLEVDQRISAILRYAQGRLEVVHLHNSNPYGEMEREEYFPHKLGSQSYQYLQRLLNEKTEVLDMITSNINGGLKGSNDDDTFSYFYVNEGLPRMLGYTHDEFMEKSGGSAVGAVYPPDLEGALADCVRCFAQGPEYSAEYRMEKKDGSLIWVLDSGRKSLDSAGITRINSIITNITPLKQALFDLEVERERYRVALEHITGVMCEYDIGQDRFTLYRQGEGASTVHKLELEGFSWEIRGGTLANEADGAAFLDLCTGRRSGEIELYTRLLHGDGQWYWGQFSCSVIRDHAGAPVRSIGILKDVTREREENEALLHQAQRDGLTGLLNHTTVKQRIEEELAGRSGAAPCGCALVMVDLDQFKDVNDLNGHAYGDKVLIHTARILEAAAGAGSLVGRIGGDEFLVWMNHVTPGDVERMAEEAVRQVRGIGADKAFSVTCSIGAVYHPRGGEPFAAFFERADRAMYRAKDQGRDRAVVDVCP